MRWSHAPGRQLANRLRIDAWLAAFINASRLGCRDALRLALLAQVRLELCEHPQHVKERLAGGRRRIDRLLGSLERYAPALQLVDDVLQILIERASRSIRVTTRVSPSRRKSSRICNSVRPPRSVPDFFSDRIVWHPAARSAASWIPRS